MARRRTPRMGFDQKVVQDVGMAALAVRILPLLVSNFFPLDQSVYTAVGAGTGYLAGTMLKNKTMANASIAIGLVEFIAPAVEGMFGGGGGIIQAPPLKTGIASPPIRKQIKGIKTVEDYINLNDYVEAPSSMSLSHYKDSY